MRHPVSTKTTGLPTARRRHDKINSFIQTACADRVLKRVPPKREHVSQSRRVSGAISVTALSLATKSAVIMAVRGGLKWLWDLIGH